LILTGQPEISLPSSLFLGSKCFATVLCYAS
jgi:hypothetical protein